MKVKLGDVATYINGYAFNPAQWGNVGLPIIRIQDLTGNAYQTNYYNGEYEKKYEVNKGDVLISWSASIGIYEWNSEKALLNQHIFKVVFDRFKIVKRFFIYQAETILKKSASATHGATMKHFTKKVFDNLPFWLPTISEQQRIADELDKVNGLIEKRQKQLEKLDLLIKSRFVEMFGGIDRINWKELYTVCLKITDGTHQPPKFVKSGIPFIFVSNIVDNEIKLDTEKYISEEDYYELTKRTPISIGDILVSTVGSYGHVAIVNTNEKFCFQRHIAYLKIENKKCNSMYVRSALLSESIKSYMDSKVNGVAQKTLNLKDLKRIKIPVPPMELQNQFADFVEKVEQNKSKIKNSLDKLITLKKALMQKYFG